MSYTNVGFMPDIDYPRSIYGMPKTHKTSWLHGDLFPIHCFRVQPGDSFGLRLSNIIRMSTPLVPFLDGIVMNVRAVFVPLRLLWTHWPEFIGANKGAGYQQNVYQLPSNQFVNLNGFSSWSDYANRSLSYSLGKNLHCINNVLTDTDVSSGSPWSVLKERGYYFIWNKLFRSTQLQAEYSIDLGDGVDAGSGKKIAGVLTSDYNSSGGYYIGKNICGHHLLKVNKMHDYFVDNCLSPQYGQSVTIGLSDYAPVGILNTGVVTVPSGTPYIGTGTGEGLLTNPASLAPGDFNAFDAYYNDGMASSKTGQVVADLTQATAATVNQLRYAFATQRWLERANYGGNNYYSIIAVHFGVTNPMARMQMPEYLGGVEYNINVNQVTNQSGFASGVTTDLGEVGAVSVTARKDDFIFRHAFTEFGFVYILGYTKHFRTYGQGIPREDLLVDDKYQILWPEFMNIGDQKTFIDEIFAGTNTPGQGFGYQEAWAEYKFFHDTVGGLLNPSLPSGALGQWSLADNYGTEPTLSSNWIQEDRNALTRCLKTGANGPDFIGDFAFKYEASRVINIKKLPGLIDHVGLF